MADNPAIRKKAGVSGWKPAQYQKFSEARLRPALDLLARIPDREYGTIHDLGCGPGTVTRILAERWPDARIIGVDQSPEMLIEATKTGADIAWVEADIEYWSPAAAPDLIYSNAALHWLNNHNRLFPRLIQLLAPGGCLAVQMPLSWNLPSHRLMRETLADGGAGGTLSKTMARRPVEDAGTYYDLLSGHAARIDIWESEYLHVLEGDNPVLEWVKGTGLRPVLDGLAGAERERFLSEYSRRLRAAYPARADGRILYPFRRLFIVAGKK